MKNNYRIEGSVVFVDIFSKGNEYEMLLDLDDFNKFKTGVRSFTRHSQGYAVLGQKYVHRLIMNPPEGLAIDHINMNKLDNRKENLRIVTNEVNTRSARAALTDGTYYQCGKWVAIIRSNGKSHYGGRFKSKEDAVAKVKELRKRHWRFMIM